MLPATSAMVKRMGWSTASHISAFPPKYLDGGREGVELPNKSNDTQYREEPPPPSPIFVPHCKAVAAAGHPREDWSQVDRFVPKGDPYPSEPLRETGVREKEGKH